MQSFLNNIHDSTIRPCPEVDVLEKRSLKCLSADDVIRLSESKIDYHRLVKERMNHRNPPNRRSSFGDMLLAQAMDKWTDLNSRVGKGGKIPSLHPRK